MGSQITFRCNNISFLFALFLAPPVHGTPLLQRTQPAGRGAGCEGIHRTESRNIFQTSTKRSKKRKERRTLDGRLRRTVTLRRAQPRLSGTSGNNVKLSRSTRDHAVACSALQTNATTMDKFLFARLSPCACIHALLHSQAHKQPHNVVFKQG